MNIFSILRLVGGLALFLFGMQVMSVSLEKMAGGRLEQLLKKMTSNRFVSLTLGAVITMAIQSSSACTVMLVGLVNSGIMRFSQTISIIFGANIGTTLTAWVLSLSGIESKNVAVQMLKPENFSAIVALVGIIMIMLGKSERKKSIGTVLIGFAILMYGMKFMTDAVSPLSESKSFAELFTRFNNPFFGVIVGVFVTIAIQSSSASVGILQALSLTGGITNAAAIPIIMGQNIGTCITSVISSVGTNANAKRVAFIHTLINVFGTVICLVIYYVFGSNVLSGYFSLAASPVSIAFSHTVFNLISTVVLMPFSGGLVWIAKRAVSDKKSSSNSFEKSLYIDDRVFLSPSVAIGECSSLADKMCALSFEIVRLVMNMPEKFDAKIKENIIAKEEELDMYEDKLGTYLVRLSTQPLSGEDSRLVSKMLHTIGEFERMGDHALNLLKCEEEIKDKKIIFSQEAKHEIKVLKDAIEEILSITFKTYRDDDVKTAINVEPLEQVIDTLAAEIKTSHINRLRNGRCTIETGFVLSDMLNNYKRVSDHCSNIAVAVIETKHNSFGTHKYLNDIKYKNDHFNDMYQKFSARYCI